MMEQPACAACGEIYDLSEPVATIEQPDGTKKRYCFDLTKPSCFEAASKHPGHR